MSAQPVVFLVDDDHGVRETLHQMLEHEKLLVKSYPAAQAFLDDYDPAVPGCLVLDVRMPGMSGLELQEILAERQIKIPIIFITGYGDVPMSVKAIKAGAVDFLQKPFRKQSLLECVNRAMAEDMRSRQDNIQRIAIRNRFSRLTPREREIMEFIVVGKSNKEIAKELHISHRTVEIHRARVFDKMEANSLPDLIAMAVVCGVCQLRW